MEKNSNSSTLEYPPIRRMRFMMGTFVEIEASGDASTLGAIEASFTEMKRVEGLLSRFSDKSVVSKINRLADASPVKVPAEVFDLIGSCLKFSRLSGGAFDISVGSVIDLWEDSQESGSPPSVQKLKNVKATFEDIQLIPEDHSIFFKKPGMKIDLGGVGKGYAIDMAVEILKRSDVLQATIDAGGNIYSLGEECISIGIRHPLMEDAIIDSVNVKNRAVSTSANYERSFLINGKSYGHIMDPRTGSPSENDILSASIISPSAMTSDMASTAVFVLGRKKGMKLIGSMCDTEKIIAVREEGTCKIL